MKYIHAVHIVRSLIINILYLIPPLFLFHLYLVESFSVYSDNLAL